MAFKGMRFTYLNMKNTFSSSLAMKIALFGVLLIPVIFAGFYLSAFLDPYARLNTVAVAVVNQDQGAEISGEMRNVGEEVCDDLREEEDGLEWHFVSAEEAQTGLEDEIYYMVCEIPSNFSQQIASADTDNPENANFTVTYHESKNMLASQIGASAWKQVQKQVNAAVIKEYWETVFGEMNDASADLTTAADGASELASGLRSAKEGNVTITANLVTLSEGSSTLESGLGTLANGAEQIDAGTQSLSDGLDTLSSGSDQLNSGLQTLNSETEKLSGLSTATSQLSTGAGQVVEGAGQVSGGATRLVSSVNSYLVTVNEAGEAVGTNLAKIGQDLGQSQTALTDLITKIETAHAYGNIDNETYAGLMSEANSLVTYLTDADNQTKAAGSTLSGLSSGDVESSLQTLQEGADTLTSGADTLTSGAETLEKGSATLGNSVGVLAGSVNALAEGSSQLNTGIQAAQTGANTLAANTPALASGASAAQAGSSAITSGAEALASGSSTLGDGLGEAVDGSDELASGLYDGAEEMQFSSDEIETRASVMSEPVELDSEYYTSVDNYGAGFAPFFLGLGVWVGCIFSGFLFNPLNRRLCVSGANPFLVAFVGYIPLALFTILQTFIAQAFVQFALGVQIDNVAAYYGMGTLTALCFMAIMQFLVAAFKFPGRFIAVVLLTLQLTSAAGTFPVETAPEFFQIINPWLPMTYVVDGLRHIMNGATLTPALYDAGILLVFAVIFFLLTVIVAYRNRTVKMTQLYPLLKI